MIDLGIKHNIKNFAYEKEDFEQMSTQQLVAFIAHIRNWYRRYFHDWYYEDEVPYEKKYKEFIDKYVCVREIWSDNYPTEYYWADENVLREILKTRPNVPNKPQRKQAIKDCIHKNKRNTKRNLKYKMH